VKFSNPLGFGVPSPVSGDLAVIFAMVLKVRGVHISHLLSVESNVCGEYLEVPTAIRRNASGVSEP
jgi:hypothetical protein